MIKNTTIYSFVRSLLGAVQLFVVSFLVIHASSMANWGNFISQYLIWSICVLVINTGSKDLVVKAISMNPTAYAGMVSGNINLRFLFSIVCGVMIMLLPVGTGTEKLMMVAAVLLRVLSATYEGIITYQKAFKKSFFIEMLSLGMICLLVVWGSSLLLLSPVYILGYLVIGDIIKIICYEWIFKLRNDYLLRTSSLLQSFREFLPFMGAGFVGLVMNKADLYLFGVLENNSQMIGQYHIINTVCNLMLVMVSALLTVRNKVIYRIAYSKVSNIQSAFFKYAAVLVFAAVTIFGMLSSFLFPFTPSMLQLFLLACIPLVFSSYALYIFLLMRADKMKVINTTFWVSGVVNIAASFIFIPMFHIEGGLLAVACGNLLSAVILRYHAASIIVQNNNSYRIKEDA